MRPNETFVGQPVRSLQAMLRVIQTDSGHSPAIVPDGIYGSSTMRAVSDFQRMHDLPVTGITDQKTWEAIVNAYDNSRIRQEKAAPIEVLIEPDNAFRSGDENPYIHIAQGMLAHLAKDHSCIAAPSHSGIMDEQTAQSVKSFQNLCKLDDNGDLDRHTWDQLVHQFTLNAHGHCAVKKEKN